MTLLDAIAYAQMKLDASTLQEQRPPPSSWIFTSAPWFVTVMLAFFAAWWASQLYRRRRADDALKERADAFHRLAAQFSALRASGATILTHDAEREAFQREAIRCGVDAKTVDRCLVGLGDAHAQLCTTRALEQIARDAELSRHDRAKRVRPFEEYLRAAEQAVRTDFAVLDQEFTFGAASHESSDDADGPPLDTEELVDSERRQELVHREHHEQDRARGERAARSSSDEAVSPPEVDPSTSGGAADTKPPGDVASSTASSLSPSGTRNLARDYKGRVHYAIITIKAEEEDAVLKLFPREESVRGERDYGISRLRNLHGQHVLVATIRQPGQGNAHATTVTKDVIADLDPDWILLVGVAGASPFGDAVLGDIVFGTHVHDLTVHARNEDGTTAFAGKGGAATQDVEATVTHLRPTLQKGMAFPHPTQALDLAALKFTTSDDEVNAKIAKSLQTRFVNGYAPRILDGQIISTDALVKDVELVRQWKSTMRSALAIEMESAGAHNAARTRAKTYAMLPIRGISDVVGLDKQEGWVLHACKLAAAGAYELVRHRLLDPSPTAELLPATTVEVATAAPPETPTPKEDALRSVAKLLLEAGTPPSLLALFADAAPNVRDALSSLEKGRRVVSKTGAATKDSKNATPQELILGGGHHIVLAPPGSGKTFALWHGAKDALESGTATPLYLPMSTFTSWVDALDAIDMASGANGRAVLRDGRVCVVLDGWTEFSAAHPNEVAACMRALASSNVVANGRTGSVGPPGFEVWTLEPFSPTTVRETVATVYPDRAAPQGALQDLLRLPLALAIHLLIGSGAALSGQLLAAMHRHLRRDMPPAFDDVLCGAVAEMQLLGGERSTARLLTEIRKRGRAAGIPDAERLLERLGTLDTRRSAVVPLHDLYWSWLAGCGMISERRTRDALSILSTRECIDLALESGALPEAREAASVSADDVVLAERLSRDLDSRGDSREAVKTQLAKMLVDTRLAVKARGAVAAIASESGELVRRALTVVTELRDAGIYLPAFEGAAKPERLFAHSGLLADWYGAHGSDLIEDLIAERGGAEWSPWVQQLANAGRMSKPVAVSILLACEGRLTPWIKSHLSALLEDDRQMYRLRAVAKRGTNLELARLLAEQFEQHLGAGNDSRFLHLRDVLVGCGDDGVFQRLLERFPTLPKRAQTLLGYTITARGEPWLARFQVVAIEKSPRGDHHELLSAPSPSIDESTARSWIAAGYTHLGLRVLAMRNVPTIARELVDALPTSFDGIHDCAPLYAMAYVKNAPEQFVDAIWSRLSGTIQPRLMEQAIRALAAVRPQGVASIAGQLSRDPSFLPAYHLMRYLEHLQTWERETSLQLRVSTGDRDWGLLEWLLAQRLKSEPDEHFLRSSLKTFGTRMVPILLEWFEGGDSGALGLLKTAGSIATFHGGVVSTLFSTGEGQLVPELFANCLDTFPEEVLMRLVESPQIEDRKLVHRLADRPSSVHRRVHVALAKRVLSRPLDIWTLRDLARLFRVHPRDELRALLQPISPQATDGIWLIREIEAATGTLLLSEDGAWRSSLQNAS